MGIQLEKTEVGPTSGPTWRLSHLEQRDRLKEERDDADRRRLRVLVDVRRFPQLQRGLERESEKGVRLAQTMRVSPCIPVGIQL